MKPIYSILAGLVFFITLFPLPASAQFCDMAVGPNSGVNTAIGCLPLDKTALTTLLLNWAIGLAGGVAFILIIVAAGLMATAGGEPKRVQAGKELLTASIMGIAVISLSVVLLNFLGVNVLGLSGLGFHL